MAAVVLGFAPATPARAEGELGVIGSPRMQQFQTEANRQLALASPLMLQRRLGPDRRIPGDDAPWCPENRPRGGLAPRTIPDSCSSVLISPTHILTAGHCVKDQADCARNSQFVFGMDAAHEKINPENLYSCRKLLHHKNDEVMDYAIIELDRPVKGVVPVTRFRLSGRAEIGTSAVTFGYPQGRTQHIGTGRLQGEFTNKSFARFRSRELIEFDARATSGQSGSPVFHGDRLEGILVDGTGVKWDQARNCLKLKDASARTYMLSLPAILGDSGYKPNPIHYQPASERRFTPNTEPSVR